MRAHVIWIVIFIFLFPTTALAIKWQNGKLDVTFSSEVYYQDVGGNETKSVLKEGLLYNENLMLDLIQEFGEKTKFQHYLDDQQIEHLVADPHSPTTTGKVERFHQSIKQELIRKRKFHDYDDAVAKIQAYVRYYNYERPHQALAGARPGDRFMGLTAAKAVVQNELLAPELNLAKGYLIFKLGVHEVSIALKADDAPKILVNGRLYVAQPAIN